MAFSCKEGRGVWPSCNGRRMVQTAAHQSRSRDPAGAVRQWVMSVPNRRRCFLADWPEAFASLTRIFLTGVEQLLLAAAGATCDDDAPRAAIPRLGAVAFVYRFGCASANTWGWSIGGQNPNLRTGSIHGGRSLHRQSPLRAPPTLGHSLGGELGRPGARAEVHAPGGQRRRRALPI